MKIAKNITELIGETPIIELEKTEKSKNLKAKLFAKLELFNPAGSIKDRVALSMVEEAEKAGVFKRGATIIEPTSGNTGVGLAMVGASKGYKVVLTMPETMSVERRNLLKAYGATLVLTDGSLGMKGAIEKAKELQAKTENSFIPFQFDNPANPLAHKKTAEEIYRDMDGKIDIFVSAVGTAGTLCGTARELKKQIPSLKAVAVEPDSSAVLSGEKSGPHKIQGIGAGFVPGNYDKTVVDEIVRITNEEAYFYANFLAKTEGVLCGISSGAALAAAVKLASMEENKDKIIVAIFPDTGERYLSTGVFDN